MQIFMKLGRDLRTTSKIDPTTDLRLGDLFNISAMGRRKPIET